MRVLLVGAGGVGTAFARLAARREVFEHIVVADYTLDRARRTVEAVETVDLADGPHDRFEAVAVDAADEKAVEALARTVRCDVVVNAVDPRFVMPLFTGALNAGVNYLDMAM